MLWHLAWLVTMLCLVGLRTAHAQTPSPLQEWQYPGGIILENLFQPEVPQWRRVAGLAAIVQPVYDGAHAYRVEPGAVVNIRYRDIAFFSIAEGPGVNLIRARHFRAGVALGYDVGRRTSSDYAHLRGLGDIEAAAENRLIGSASESPITQRRTQRTLALATAYQW